MALKVNTGSRGGLKEGVYLLRIDDAEDGKSSSGNDYIKLKLSVLVNGRLLGVSFNDFLTLNEASAWKVRNIFDAMEAPDNIDVDANWFKGKQVYARVKIEEYQDESQPKVTRYMTNLVAEKQLALAAEAGDTVIPMYDEDSASKTRGRASKNTRPAELQEEESMPL